MHVTFVGSPADQEKPVEKPKKPTHKKPAK